MFVNMLLFAYRPIFSSEEKAWSLHSSCHDYSIMEYENGDTIIGSIKYHKIIFEDLSKISTELFLIQEDINKKTVSIHYDDEYTDFILYDFNIQGSISQVISKDKTIVYNVLKKSIEGEHNTIDIEVFVKSKDITWSYMDKWIEGIGGNYGLTHQPWMDDFYNECNENFLVCVSNIYKILFRSEYEDKYPCESIVCYDCLFTENNNIIPDSMICQSQKQIRPDGLLQILLPDGRRFDVLGREIK